MSENQTPENQTPHHAQALEQSPPRWFHPLTYLFGSRRAIFALVASKHLVWLALLMLATGALARNYDGASLLDEPSLLLHGLGASLINSTVLFALMAWLARGKGLTQAGSSYTPLRAWGTFLLLFWMTSPMAWLYAIPYEQFLSPINAISLNGMTLSIVSLWRVLLIARVLSVLWHARFWQTLCIVLGFSAPAVFIAAQFSPMPLVDFMGGMRFTTQERMISDAAASTIFFSFLASPVCVIAAAVALYRGRACWSIHHATRVRSPNYSATYPATHLAWWGLPAFALVALAVGLAIMQPKQQRRYRIEKLIRAGQILPAMQELSRYTPQDLPTNWDIPPRYIYRERHPTREQLQNALVSLTDETKLAAPIAPWVRSLFFDKAWRELVRDAELAAWDADPEASNPAKLGVNYAGEAVPRIFEKKHSYLDASQTGYRRQVLWHRDHNPNFTVEDIARINEWVKALN